jgi:Mrp family chromosome partitioning ATPase
MDTAIPPVYPERPLLLRNAATSIPVGLLLSLGFVLLAEARRAGLRSREDLDADRHAMLGLVPCVASVGHDDPDAKRAGKMAEYFRSIAHGSYGTVTQRRVVKRHLEHLFLSLADGDGARVCAFISLSGGEGKSFLIEQLARLAGETGRTVLLVDANLTDPVLDRAFHRTPSAGLAEVLSGAAAAADVVVSVAEGVDLIGAGTAPIKGRARWDLPACKALLNGLAANYDLVLIDTAALRNDPAVSRLLVLADRLVCVFDATASSRDDPDAVREHLRGSATPVCFVLNKVRCKADHLFGAGSPQERGRATATTTTGPAAR